METRHKRRRTLAYSHETTRGPLEVIRVGILFSSFSLHVQLEDEGVVLLVVAIRRRLATSIVVPRGGWKTQPS